MTAVATDTVATWIVAHSAVDIYWRCQLPAEQLGAKVIVAKGEDARDFEQPGGSAFRWEPTDDGAHYPDVEGTAVFTRPDNNRAAHAIALAANGHRIVAEVDDNYLANPNLNIFMRQNRWGPDARENHMRAFLTMDAIICSTQWLRDEYHATLKKFVREKERRDVPDLFVARNHVDDGDPRWLDQDRRGGRLRVGIQGSHQHIWDWRLAAPALHLAKEMGCEVVLMGLDPAEHDPRWRDFLGEYTHLPWADPELYHSQHIPFDIGLAPVVTNKHTLGKSDVKALEYTMSGVACVLQNNDVYNTEWRHNETCVLAGGPDEMARQMARLIRDAKLRREIVENARAYVRANRTIQGNLDEWREPILG